jgi:hypothetical protein
MRRAHLVGVVAIVAGLGLTSPPAEAAAPFVYRGLTLPRGDFALDLGLGLGHAPYNPGPDDSITGFGMNLELKAGVSYDLELGVRTGFRFDYGGRVTQADSYGRLFETETYGVRYDSVANPEIRLTWAVAHGAVAQLGLEGRMYLPAESGSYFGVMVALPLWLRLANVRFDSGLYVPIIFTEPNTTTIVSVPLHIWIQATGRFWLGPLFGLRIVNPPVGNSYDEYPVGFGLGTMLAQNLDLRFWFLFPDMSRPQAARWFGTGVSFQIRF